VSVRTATDGWAVGRWANPADDAGFDMLAERWNGITWTRVPAPGVLHFDETALAVSASGAADAWAVGYTRVISNRRTRTIAFHWNGTAWSIVATPSTSGRDDRLSGVVDFGATNAWAAGAGNNQPLVEHWDGTSWQPVALPALGPSGSTGGLTSLSAVSASDIWAMGTVSSLSGTTVVSTAVTVHYDGVRWTAVPVAKVSGSYLLRSISADSPTDAWMVGETIPSPGLVNGKTLTEHWDGTAWRVVASPTPGFTPNLTGVSARAPGDAWAVGSGSGTGLVLRNG